MAKELNLGVIFYGVATKALAEITKLETRVKQLNTGFVASGKAATGSSKAMATQAKGAKGLANEMSLVGKKIGQVSGGIQRLTAAMKVTASYGLAATAIFGVINAFKAGTAAIFDFDQALKNLQAITGAIDAEIAVLGDKIREVAARTKYSAKEVSDATVLLGQAGFDAAESLDAIEAVAMLATGTLTDMATTADLLTTAIRAFGLETSESGRIADIFATAVNKSKLTIDKLRTAFNYLGPVASNAGLSLEETAASTMVLANAGLRGSTIGTGFRQVLARLIAPSEKLRLAFRAAGADLEKLNPLTNDFSVVLDELSKVVTHSGIAIRLFGMRASAAAVAIAKGNDKYKEMLDYTYRVGVATEMAEKQMEGLAVMAKNLGDKLHNLAIALGEGGIAGAFRIVLNILRPLVDLMTLAADNVVGRFVVAVTSLTVVITALTLAARYLVIQLSAVALGYTVAAVKAMAAAEGANLLLIAFTALGKVFVRLGAFLKVHPIVAVSAIIASLVVGIKLWIDSTAKQTIELQKQSIELDKSVHSLKGYRDQLEDVEEGSKKHEAVIGRLIKDYPNLTRAVDIHTTSIHDQIDAIEGLIKIKAAEHLQTELQVYLRLSEAVKKHAENYRFLLQRRKDNFAFGKKHAEQIKEYAREEENLADTVKYLTRVMASHLKILEGATGVDFSSSIQDIEKYVRRMNTAFTSEEVKLWAERIKAYFDDVKKQVEGLGSSLIAEMKVFSVEWVELFESLLETDVVSAHKLLKLFDDTLKEVGKLGREMEQAGADPDKIKAAQEKIKRIRLKAFIDGLDEQKKEYKAFFDKIEAMQLKALDKNEASEKKAAENRHAKRMADFKKDFEAEDDYLVQMEKAKIRSHDLMEKERAAITEKYAKERLDNETEIAVETEKLMLEIAKKGVDERVAAGIDTIEEGNRKKAELEVQYHWTVAQIYTDIFNNIKAKYGEDTKEYVKALNDKLKALAEFEKVQAKLITIDLEDLKDTEKIYEQFLNNVQNAFADTFYDIFKGQWEGWEDLMGDMKDLFLRVLAEMVARAAMTKITTTIKAEGKGGGTGGSAISSLGWFGAAVGTLSAISSHQEKGAERRQEKWAEEVRIQKLLWKTLQDVNSEINDILNPLDSFAQELLNVHATFDEYKVTLTALGASVEQLNAIEEKRTEVIEKTTQALKKQFETSLEDMIAGLTLDPMAHELYQLNNWYASLIDQARTLGEESVKFLWEAYEISKKQLVLKEREAMISATGDFLDIIATIGLTPIETQLYYLEKSKEEADVDVSGFEASIDALEASVDTAEATILSLSDALAAATIAYESAFEFDAYHVMADFAMLAVQQAGGTSEEQYLAGLGWMEEHLAELISRGLSTINIDADIAALNAAWAAHAALYLPSIESIPGEIIDLKDAILGWEGDIDDLQILIDDLIAAGSEAYSLQLEALKKSVPEGWAEIIRDLTLTDFEKALLALDEWYAEQLIAATVLSLALDDLNLAYDLQLQALQDLAGAIDDTIKSIDDMIESLTGGALAPVQSAEYYMDKYAGFLEAAMMGTAGAVDELLGFIPEYLDFMGDYGGDYAGLTASIVAALENLKLTLPGLQHGGLTSGLSFAGEAGPEWIVPTYEPQRSSFLEDVGMDPDKIGEAIARHLIPALGSREINLTIDGQPVRAVITKGLRSDSELINAVRRVN